MASVTILDVAAAAQVSKTTASDILRGADRGYNAVTVETVRSTATRLGYQANAAARLLRQGSTNIIGLAVGARQRHFINSIVVAAHDECIKRSYQPAIFEPYHLLPQHNFSPFPSPALLAGILSIDLSVTNLMPDFYASWHNRLPIVALYPVESSEIDSVTTDWGRGIEMAVEHLVELGHSQIAYAHDPALMYSIDRLRTESWQRCVKKYRLDPQCQLSYTVPSSIATLGTQLINAPPQPIANFVEQVINQLRGLKHLPTALLCTSDELAIALMGRLTQLGWKLPQDLSVVGFYGIDFGEYVYPQLTSVAQPLDLISSAALDRLQTRIALKAKDMDLEPCRQFFEPRMIIRQSTAPPRQNKVPPLV